MDGAARAAKASGDGGLVGLCLGNALAYYDLLIFSVMAVQISQAIFPEGDPFVGLMQTLCLVGVSYVVRPAGAILLGRYADRAGRRRALLVAFALSGIAVIGQALVPSYATAGIVAPVLMLVCRVMIGIAMGGEFGATTAMLIECAGAHRRGAFVALQLAGQDIGRLAAGLVALLLAAALSPAQLVDWGWRAALLVGGSIVPYGLYLRARLAETLAPAAAAGPAPRDAAAAPARAAAILLFLAALFVADGIKYLAIYAQTVLGLAPKIAFGSTVALSLTAICFSLLGGRVSDGVGRRPVILAGIAFSTLAILPCFLVLNALPGLTSLVVASGVLAAGLAFSSAPLIAALAELVPPRRRALSLSVTAAFGVALINGTADLAITWLLRVTGAPLAPAWAMTAAGLVALAAAWVLPRARDAEAAFLLSRSDTARA